jgi:hypothetical protein
MTNGFSKSNWIPASQQPHSRKDCKPRRFDLRDADDDSEKRRARSMPKLLRNATRELSQERVWCYVFAKERYECDQMLKFQTRWTPTQVTTHAPSVSSREHV